MHDARTDYCGIALLVGTEGNSGHRFFRDGGIVNHLEMWKAEAEACAISDWEKWCTRLETLMGHTMDGDFETDGYSMDEVYEMWRDGDTIYAASYAIQSRGVYHGAPAHLTD